MLGRQGRADKPGKHCNSAHAEQADLAYRAGQFRIGQGRVGLGREGQGRAGPGRTGQGRKGRPEQGSLKISHGTLVFCPKCVMGKVEMAMFQGVATLFELVFCLLKPRKCDLRVVEKATFQGLARPFGSLLSSSPFQNTTWMRSRKRCFKWSTGTANLFSAS